MGMAFDLAALIIPLGCERLIFSVENRSTAEIGIIIGECRHRQSQTWLVST
jgi:hypothetical protein